MKKAISLLLALAVILSLSSVAFAAEDIPGTFNANNNTGRGMLGRVMQTPGSTPGSTSVTSVEAGELFLVERNKKIVGTDTELRPDEEYEFDIYYATSRLSGDDANIIANSRKLVTGDIGDGTVRLRTLKGSSAISSAKVRTVGSGSNLRTYRVEIDTRANYGTKTTDVEYSLNVNDPTTNNIFDESIHTFVVGFNSIDDSDTDVGEDGVLTISNDTPVILKEQFEDITKSANYKNITIESDDGNWSWKGKVTGMKDSNFSYDYDPNINLLNMFPDQEFKFLNFPAGVNFPTTGEMRIDVSDVSEAFRTMYVYLYRDGRLTAITGNYDAGADEIVFRTNYLGRFVVTNMPITDTALMPEEPVTEEPDDIFEEEEPVPPTTNNPTTGASDSTDAMLAIGFLALASGAVVSRRRKF